MTKRIKKGVRLKETTYRLLLKPSRTCPCIDEPLVTEKKKKLTSPYDKDEASYMYYKKVKGGGKNILTIFL